ncbi:MAG: OmpA family protein [Salinivirgaceae bacterium]|jgi:OOP family OmpA-OmpF porin|nr:OmpA family protein [Salinivirgaceae bacterium]
MVFIRILVLLVIIIVANASIYSQNLIKNNSFEEGLCPSNYSEINFAKYWSGFSSDYFRFCLPKSHYDSSDKMSVPYNIEGYQKANSGNAYTGLGSAIEYLVTEFKTPLIKDSIYYGEFYTNLSNYSTYAIWDIGMYLSNEYLRYSWGSKLFDTINPQIKNPYCNYIVDTLLWAKVSGFYKAKGGEKYLYIGSFKSSINSELEGCLMVSESKYKKRYYYFDDVYFGSIFRDLEYTVRSLLFDNDKFILSKDSIPELKLIAEYLVNNSAVNVHIIGHTDNVGDSLYNFQLSNRRAKFIADYFLKNGIDLNRIRSKGCGSRFPLEPNNSEIGRRKNRRVELKFQ